MVFKKMNSQLNEILEKIGANAKKASTFLNKASTNQKNRFFEYAISEIKADTKTILAVNQQDINDAKNNQKDSAFIDRLELNYDRIGDICKTLDAIKSFDDPVGKVLAR